MIDDLPLFLTFAVLIGALCRAAVAVMSNRRSPAPNMEQALTGLGLGIMIGAAFVQLCMILPQYLF